MKVKDLVAKLAEQDPESEVHFAHDYGDRRHTVVTKEVGAVFEAPISWSEYHRSHTMSEDEDEEPGDDDKLVVILR